MLLGLKGFLGDFGGISGRFRTLSAGIRGVTQDLLGVSGVSAEYHGVSGGSREISEASQSIFDWYKRRIQGSWRVPGTLHGVHGSLG